MENTNFQNWKQLKNGNSCKCVKKKYGTYTPFSHAGGYHIRYIMKVDFSMSIGPYYIICITHSEGSGIRNLIKHQIKRQS